ncbi:hypothetical protein CAG99_24770 [Streptomyces marincola]|uniref:Protein-L-isoaspartate O-methyltransferase n=2 Tax=Streptomyces marincola TaxID=2878388 RepID=A0A1W7D3L3_9ACTN|nr:hypothetical protein CAG99_24770 [Streptomyces marincola]
MADTMMEEGALASPHWHDAFRTIARDLFVPRFTIGYGRTARVYERSDDGYPEAVYTDTSLVTRWDEGGTPVSSSSAPSLMARMLEAFTPGDGPVMEIGTGTGYNCALMCHRFGAANVVSVDVDPVLTREAREKLAEHDFAPTLVTGDGTSGYRERAPYSGILATCGVERVPTAWLRQVRPGGVIVTNIGTGIARLIVSEGHGAEGEFLPEPASFMRARPTSEYVARTAPQYTKLIIHGTGRSRTVVLPDYAAGTDQFLSDLTLASALEISVMQHDVLSMSLITSPEAAIHGLVHPDSESWARIMPGPDNTVEVSEAGPRSLWDERLNLFTDWNEAGQPSPGAYRLTVTPDGTHHLSRGARSWTASTA